MCWTLAHMLYGMCGVVLSPLFNVVLIDENKAPDDDWTKKQNQFCGSHRWVVLCWPYWECIMFWLGQNSAAYFGVVIAVTGILYHERCLVWASGVLDMGWCYLRSGIKVKNSVSLRWCDANMMCCYLTLAKIYQITAICSSVYFNMILRWKH